MPLPEFYEGARCSSVNSNGRGKYIAVFTPAAGERYFLYVGEDRNEAELAVAQMKAEWIFQECEAAGVTNVMREVLRFFAE